MQTTFRFIKHEFLPEQGSTSFSYQLQTSEKTYDFTEKLHFQPIVIPNTKYQILDTVLDNLLLIIGISYWKTTCAKKIELPESIQLTKDQADFWNTVYTKGLGEFYFKNNIDYRGLINFPYSDSVILNESEGSQSIKSHSRPDPRLNRGDRESFLDSRLRESDNKTIEQSNNNRSLVFFGGGKDSIVSAELLKQRNIPFDLFFVDGVELQKNGANIVGAKTVEFKRELDPQLFELNKKEGIYNGHIPISAVWAFLSIFAAVLYGYKNLITSNEYSANYGNVEYLGEEINHQWSKSLEFEKMFRAYVQKNISQRFEYFSLLRPLYEIKIAELFSKNPQYFMHFSSCNRNFVISRHPKHLKGTSYTVAARDSGSLWCGKCPKCLFVFTLLSAFIDKKTLLDIFGKNLFDDYSLVPLLRELLNLENFKPFECVGTPEETALALIYASQKKDYQNDVLISLFLQSFLTINNGNKKLQETLLQAKLPACLPHEFAAMIESI